MNFSTPKLITATLQAGDEVERIRGTNRALITGMGNGLPFLDPNTAQKWKMDVNFNAGEGPVLLAHAKRQYDNAVLGSQFYFRVTIPKAPEEKKSGWGSFITNRLGEIMKNSPLYECLKEYQISSLVTHGIGPQMWRDREDWCPDFVAVRNFRVPKDTLTSFKDQSWLAERHEYSPGELARKVFGENSDPRWNKSAVQSILNSYDDLNYEQSSTNWITLPEKRMEQWKQDLGHFSSDAVPSISLWHFFYYDDTDPKDCFWKLCVIPDWAENAPKGVREPEFLFESGDRPFAKDINQFISVQYGDLNVDAPFHHHSVRSLGFSIYEPCFWNNLAICRQVQHLFESYNPWFRVDDPTDRARVAQINLATQSVMEKGVSIVPNTERHHVDPQLIESTMAKLKQLQSEASQSYTQSTDTGTAREQTAFETRVKLSSVNAMMSGLLGRFFRKERHSFREICRRFCLSVTMNKDAKSFQNDCLREGIPRHWLNVDRWNIEPEMPLGSGNPTMAMTMIEQLMQLYPMLSPTAQTEVVHEALEVYTNDPRKAERWQPIGKEPLLSEGKKWAGAVFGSLMTGVPIPVPDGLPAADIIEVWLGMMAGVVTRIKKTDNIGTMPEIVGLQNVGQMIAQELQKLSQVQSEKRKVKDFGDNLGQLMNEVKGFQQRLTQKNAQNNGDPEAQAKVQALIQTTQAKLHAKQLSDAQKMAQKEQSFHAEQNRKDLQVLGDQKRQHTSHNAEQQREDDALNAEIARKDELTGTDLAHASARTASDIANSQKTANAQAKQAKRQNE